MTIPTDEDWIEWGRELARVGDDNSRRIILQSFDSVPSEIRLHWAPFALGMTSSSLQNYIINLEIISESEFDTAKNKTSSDFPSWFEILKAANVAFEVDASDAYDFWDSAFHVFRHWYPDLVQSCPRSLEFRTKKFEVVWGGDIVSMDNAFSDFLEEMDDSRRTCWIKSSYLESQPIIFGRIESVDRLTKRLGLGPTNQMPRAIPRLRSQDEPSGQPKPPNAS